MPFCSAPSPSNYTQLTKRTSYERPIRCLFIQGAKVRPIGERWARIGPKNPRWFQHVPPAGLCLSVFLVVRNRRGDVLLGRPRRHKAWPEWGCMPYWRLDPIIENQAWVLPASHLMMEEHPDHAAGRIARTWARLLHASPRLVALDSSRMPSDRRAGRGKSRRMLNHWAIGFVYEVRSDVPPGAAPWWDEMRFFPVQELRKVQIGRAHRDLLRYLKEGRRLGP